MKDVAVLCRELGCGAAKKSPSGFQYEPSTEKEQKVLIQMVNCSGMEDTLAQCKQDEDVFDCSLEEEAGASCESKYGRLKDHLAQAPHGQPLLLVFFLCHRLSHND
jgi:hypothetical protein